jgi:hypothetical protein
MDNPWKAILAFIGVFAAGAIFGGVFTLGIGRKFDAEVKAPSPASVVEVVPQPPKKDPAQPNQPGTQPKQAGAQPAQIRIQPAIMRQLTKRLSPTAEQQKLISPIVGRATEDLQRMGRDHIADTARVTERMYEDIKAILSPEQRAQLEKMRLEMLERARQERMKRGAVESVEAPNRAGTGGRPAGSPAPKLPLPNP